MNNIFKEGPVSLNCGRVARCIRMFVARRTTLDFSKLKTKNLFNAVLKEGYCEFSPLSINDMYRSGRQLEVRFAIGIAIAHPEATVGITRAVHDNGVDIVVKINDSYMFFDTKDSKKASTAIIPQNLAKLSKFKDWVLYIAPGKNLSYKDSGVGNVQILSVQNAIINMSKSAVFGTVGDKNLAIVKKIEQDINDIL